MSGKKRILSGDDFSGSDGEIGGTSSMLKSRKKRKAFTATPLCHSAPSPKIFWSKNDELAILKGVVDYQKERGVEYFADSDAFVEYIRDGIDSKFSKDQVMRKIRKLKAKFQDNLVKQPSFTVAHDSKMFDLSLAIWGKDKAVCVDGAMDQAKGIKTKRKRKVVASVEHEGVRHGEKENGDRSAKGESGDVLPSENADKNLEDETGGKESEKDEAVANGKLKNDDGSAKTYSWGGEMPSDCVDKHVENETGEMENGEDGAEDELCALQDALEATVFQGLSNCAQKMMLRKLRSIRAKERKELSDEWKALLVEEIQLKIKKQRFLAKLTDEVLQG